MGGVDDEKRGEPDWRTSDDPVLRDAKARLERAERNFNENDDKKALSELERAQASSSSNLGATRDILDLATRISERSDGRAKSDAEGLVGRLSGRALALSLPPAADPPPRWRTGMPVTTTPFLPGVEVVDYIGEVFGVVVRSRGAIPAFGAQLKAIVGGELKTMTNLLDQSRRRAIERMVAEAEARGADAIISMRFDADSIGDG